MLPTWLRQLTNPKSPASGRSLRTLAPRKPSCRLQLEHLEDRLTPATHTWTGMGNGGLWSDPNNWNQTISLANDTAADLIFPAGPSDLITDNLSNLTIRSMTFNGPHYEVWGPNATLTLTGDVTDNATDWNDIHLSGFALSDNLFSLHTFSVATGGLLQMDHITGSGSLTKAGGGTLQLWGPGNTYAGYTSIGAGTLQAYGNDAIPSTSAVTVAGGATFDVNGYIEDIGSLSGAGNVTLGTAGYLDVVGHSVNTTFSGVISGTNGTLNVEGTGTSKLTLSGHNTYTGQTFVAAGNTLQLGIDNAIASASDLTVSGTFDLNNFRDTVASLLGNQGNPQEVKRGRSSFQWSPQEKSAASPFNSNGGPPPDTVSS
jgi:autotransporter-associated beta strand protein